MTRRIVAGDLEVAYEEHGPPAGPAVLLLHGFPYDIHAFDEVAPRLAMDGCRVVVPYLRGFGATRFMRPETPRSGQQAALAHDALKLLDALAIPAAVLAGYDWGGRAACIVAALWPARATGLVSCGGYTIQDIAGAAEPLSPDAEHRYWYQYYFHGERGRAGLARHRREFCRLLWRLWSPNWNFDDQTWERSAGAFDNADFVEVVIHSYRHRYGLVAGDPAYAATEQRLAALPRVAVPAVALYGGGDGVTLAPARAPDTDPRFAGPFRAELIPRVGHNLPQEAPQAFAAAVRSLLPTG